MYQSPIQLFTAQMAQDIAQKQDEMVFQAAISCVPQVDRAELLRALQYDRGQYDKGYADGFAEALPRWIPTEYRLPDRELEEFREKFGWEGDPELLVMIKGAKVPTTLYYNEEGEFYSIDTDGNDTYYVVTHWMSMPTPPAAEEVPPCR